MMLRMLIWVFVFCGSVFAESDPPKPTERQQMDALVELMHYVRQNYYEETNTVDLLHGAIEGYVSQLDPHSTYIRPDELHDTQERLRGSFEGIGIFFEIVDNVLTVLSPIEGSPAFRAGLLPGDQIYRIDGKSALNLKTKDVTDMLKGTKGTHRRCHPLRRRANAPQQRLPLPSQEGSSAGDRGLTHAPTPSDSCQQSAESCAHDLSKSLA